MSGMKHRNRIAIAMTRIYGMPHVRSLSPAAGVDVPFWMFHDPRGLRPKRLVHIVTSPRAFHTDYRPSPSVASCVVSAQNAEETLGTGVEVSLAVGFADLSVGVAPYWAISPKTEHSGASAVLQSIGKYEQDPADHQSVMFAGDSA